MLFKYQNDYGRRNFEICSAINLTSLRCATDRMIKDGSISLQEAEAYCMQAKGLLEIITLRNKQGFESKIL